MLVNIFGGLGSGKTLLAVILCKSAMDKGKNVFANIKVNGAKPLSLIDFLEYNFPPNSLVLLDEVYTLAESRLSLSDVNLLLSHIAFQSRKKGLDIITTAQLRRAIDVRLRALSDVDVLAQRRGKDFSYIVFYNNELAYPRHFVIKYNVAKKFFNEYNTFEIVEDEFYRKRLERLKKKIWGLRILWCFNVI